MEANQSVKNFGTAGIVAQTVIASNITNIVNGLNTKELSFPVRLIDAPSKSFRGRDALFDEVHTYLSSHRKSTHYLDRTVAITGMGGMGKSEFARTFASRYKDYYDNVVWVNAGTVGELAESFKEIASEMGGLTADNTALLAQKIYKTFDTEIKKSRWRRTPTVLFVFDNAEQMMTTDSGIGIHDYLPQKEMVRCTPFFLITSQVEYWGTEVKLFPLSELNSEESIKFFRDYFGLSTTSACKAAQPTLEKLTGKLQGYPLAIKLAAGSIDFVRDREEVGELVKKLELYLESFDRKFLDQKFSAHMPEKYRHTLATVWAKAMARLQDCDTSGGMVMGLLRLACHISPEWLRTTHIVSAFAYINARTYTDELWLEVESSLVQLERLCLVSLSRHNNEAHDASISIHRILRKAVLATEGDILLCTKNVLRFCIHNVIPPASHFEFLSVECRESLVDLTTMDNELLILLLVCSVAFPPKEVDTERSHQLRAELRRRADVDPIIPKYLASLDAVDLIADHSPSEDPIKVMRNFIAAYSYELALPSQTINFEATVDSFARILSLRDDLGQLRLAALDQLKKMLEWSLCMGDALGRGETASPMASAAVLCILQWLASSRSYSQPNILNRLSSTIVSIVSCCPLSPYALTSQYATLNWWCSIRDLAFVNDFKGHTSYRTVESMNVANQQRLWENGLGQAILTNMISLSERKLLSCEDALQLFYMIDCIIQGTLNNPRYVLPTIFSHDFLQLLAGLTKKFVERKFKFKNSNADGLFHDLAPLTIWTLWCFICSTPGVAGVEVFKHHFKLGELQGFRLEKGFLKLYFKRGIFDTAEYRSILKKYLKENSSELRSGGEYESEIFRITQSGIRATKIN